MNNLGIFALLIAILFVPLCANMAFAQETYVINIPTGAADITAPYFWQSEKDGDTSGKIEVRTLDYVRWENADTAAHTVTSGTPEDGPDKIFDSSLFAPGKDFQYQFTEAGNFDYFCMVHPWMTGVVIVSQASSDLQVIPNVGAKAGDGKTTFNVEYEFNRMIVSATIDEEQNAINFEITSEGGINEVIIPLDEKSERLTIVGASVVPEFGAITMAILAIGVLSFIALTFKTQKICIPKL